MAASNVSWIAQLRSDFLTLTPFLVRCSQTVLVNVDAVHFCDFAICPPVTKNFPSGRTALSLRPNGRTSKTVRFCPQNRRHHATTARADQVLAGFWRSRLRFRRLSADGAHKRSGHRATTLPLAPGWPGEV